MVLNGPVKQKNAIIFLSISLNMCFGYSKELSNGDGSFEYTAYVLVRNKKNNFKLHTLIWGHMVLYIERVFILYIKTNIVYARIFTKK